MTVSQDAIDKAKALLGIVTSEATIAPEAETELTKGEDAGEIADEAPVTEDVAPATEGEDLEKAEATATPEAEPEAAAPSVEELIAERIAPLIEKAEETAALAKANGDLAERLASAVTLLQSLEQRFDDVVNQVAEKLTDQSKKIAAFGSSPVPSAVVAPAGEVSVLTKADAIEDLGDGYASRDDIMKALDDEITAGDSWDQGMMEAQSTYEITGNLPIEARVRLRKKGLKIR